MDQNMTSIPAAPADDNLMIFGIAPCSIQRIGCFIHIHNKISDALGRIIVALGGFFGLLHCQQKRTAPCWLTDWE